MMVIDASDLFTRARDIADRRRACENRVSGECLMRGWDRNTLDSDQKAELVQLVRREELVAHAASKLQTQAFVTEYCKAMRWEREDLTIAQMNQIIVQPGYSLNGWCSAELPDDLREVERSMPPYTNPVAPEETP